MLRIETNVGPSRIHGLGLFAAASVRKGTLVWKYDEGFDLLIPKDKVAAMPDVPMKTLERHGADHGDLLFIVLDEGKYFNHDDDPNCVQTGEIIPEYRIHAARDIAEGEELTLDYRTICDDPWYGFEVAP